MPENPSIADIEDKLIREVAAILSREPAEIDPAKPLAELGIDSLSFVEMLVFIEKAFALNLVEAGLVQEDLRTIRTIAQRIARSFPAS